jgi:hypothetical protein
VTENTVVTGGLLLSANILPSGMLAVLLVLATR